MEKTLEILQEENAQLEAANKALRGEVEVLQAVNDELTEKVEELSAVKSGTEAAEKPADKKPLVLPKDHFEVEGKKYRFNAPVFTYKRQRVVAEEALLGMALLAELVAAEVGTIREVK